MNIDPKKVTEVFEDAPKLISPLTHAWLDVAVTSAFAIAGIVFASRGRKAAAVAAFINAGMVAGVSLATDYTGQGDKPISFKMHGFMDIVQAATAGTAPLLMGFAGEPEAALFYGQAGSEVGVVALTDWDAGERDSDVLDYAA